MKISKIIIPNYQQFRNFRLDLTYPENHKKAGQPLDKICFIGRNATGKTTLLNLITDIFYTPLKNTTFDWLIYKINTREGNYYLCSSIGDTEVTLFSEDIEQEPDWYSNFSKHSSYLELTDFKSFYREYIISNNDRVKKILKLITLKNKADNLIINTPAESQENVLLEITNVPETTLNSASELFKNRNVYHEVSNQTINKFWNQLIYNLKKRENDFNEYLEKNENRVYSEVKKEFDKKNPTILKEIAKLWDKILGKAGLYFDYENAKNPIQLTDNLLAYIKLKSTDKTIPYNKLSAGIRNFIFRLGHIYSLYFNRKIENGFLLIDEPENSLYPDFLYDLIETYEKIIHNTQFFVATHNPIIAAQFDPAERIYLDFDETGYVVARKGVTPEGDDPNDILEKDFLIRSLLGKPAKEKWERFLALKSLIQQTKSKDKKHEYMSEYLQIGNSYNFPLQ